MSDTSPPLHEPFITPTSLQPDSFQCRWDSDQHYKSQKNVPKTIPAQTKQITFISYYGKFLTVTIKKLKKKEVKVQV
jgi:hypothetical protein